MSELDEIYAKIPTSGIATQLGIDEGEVDTAVRNLVPALLGGLAHNSEDPEHASKIESAASSQAASGLLDAGTVHVNEDEGHQAVSTLFGGNDTDQVALALSKGGAGDSDLIKKLLPLVLPVVLAYIGQKLAPAPEPKQEQASGGGLGDVLGSILGGNSGDKGGALGSILGSVLSGKGGGLGDILGGLLGGKK
jgi:hypothetical protein